MSDNLYHLPLPAREEEDEPGAELVGPVYEAEIVPEDIHPLDEVAPWDRVPEVRPAVPTWLSTREQVGTTVRWALRYAGKLAAFHALRLPLYAARFGARVPVGAGRVLAVLYRWAADMGESSEARRAAIVGNEIGAYVALSRLADARRVARAKLAVVGAVLLLSGYLSIRFLAPPGTGRWALTVLLVGLGLVGRRRDRPIVSSPLSRAGYVALTWPVLSRALTVAGLGGKPPKTARDGTVVEDVIGTPTLAGDITRDGQGFRAVVDLPYGKTFADAAKARDAIASGLDVAPVQVFLEAVPASARRVLMWVADRDPYVGRPNPSPLARCPRVSVWDPQRLGVEPRGRVVSLPLIFNGFLVGANPRQGKTYLIRTLLAPAILDPHCDITVLGAKSSDWEDIDKVAVSYNAGEGDDASVEYCVAALRRLRDEVQARYDALRALPREERPEGKITPELADKGFRPHAVVLEEAQNVLGHRDAHGKRSALAKEALYLCSFLAKVGPAAGFILVIATQRPSAEVIPTDLRDVLSVHIALKVNDRTSSDAILGDYRAARGIESASLINLTHAGVAVVVGVDNGRGSDYQTIRTDLTSSGEFARICRVGRQRRVDAGTLRGMAAGEADAVEIEVSLVADVEAVWPGVEPKVWGQTICDRLGRLRPDLYGGFDTTSLTKALGRSGVESVQIKRDGSNQRGYELAAIRKALGR